MASRIRLALTNGDVAEAFRYLDHPMLIWFDLYMIAEVVERSVGGPRELLKRAWLDKDYKRFRQTANHYRHAKHPTKNQLPASPMKLVSARRYVTKLVDEWLRNEYSV